MHFSDDLFIGAAPTSMGLANRADSTIFTGSIASTTLTVTAMLTGEAIKVGQYISGSSVTAGSYITAFGTGTGGTGTYTVSTASNASSTTIYAAGNNQMSNPSPMGLGVGPLGRIYVWDVIPEAAATNNVALTQTPAAAAMTLTAGAGTQSIIRPDGTTVVQLDCPRGVAVTTGAAAAALVSPAVAGTAGQFTCTATTGLVVGQKVVISGTAGGSGSITGYTDPTTYYIIATNGTTTFTLSLAAGGAAIASSAGTLSGLTFTRAFAAVAFTVAGYDYYGQPMSEAITCSTIASTAVNGKKAFWQIASITPAQGIGGAAIVGTTNVLGLPVRMTDAGYLARIGWAGTLAENAATVVVADLTSPATTTTGDVRGTLATASSNPDGLKRLVVGILVSGIACGPSGTRVGALGVTQV